MAFSAIRSCRQNGIRRWGRRHGLAIDPDSLVFCTGVVPAISSMVRKLTTPNENVVIMTPVYNIFFNSILNNGCRVLESPLAYDGEGHYEIDWADFETKLADPQTTLMILCNPHNPIDRIWDCETLERIGELCWKHHVTVVSDEIHNDFVYPGYEHTVFATVDPRFAEFTVTCTAPSKTFNLAGLQISNIFIPNEKLRKAFQTEIDKTGYDEPNALGIVACEAAYRAGEDWLDQLRAYLLKNLNFLRNFLQEKIPQIHLVEPEGTYLVWLDCSELGITGKELDQFIVDKAGLWLDGGSMFGPSGAAFQRVNIACPQATLELALNKLKAAVDNLE